MNAERPTRGWKVQELFARLLEVLERTLQMYKNRYFIQVCGIEVECAGVSRGGGWKPINYNGVTLFRRRLKITLLLGLCFTYCSAIWRPHLVKKIIELEKIQRRATKHKLNDFTLDYKSRLISSQLFPLMMTYEINDLVFFLHCLKSPSKSFNITDFVTFSSSSTCSSSSMKLKHSLH